jgi:hypothetical protein
MSRHTAGGIPHWDWTPATSPSSCWKVNGTAILGTYRGYTSDVPTVSQPCPVHLDRITQQFNNPRMRRFNCLLRDYIWYNVRTERAIYQCQGALRR